MSDFSNMDVSVYRSACLLPQEIETLFVLESPPAFTGNLPTSYFYFKDGPGLEVLFSTVMRALYGINNYDPCSKLFLLNRF
jgi:hypothetical protein